MTAFALAGVGAVLGIFSASAANKKAKAAAARARASALIQGSRQKNANAIQTSKIVGNKAASFGERNVYGRSSQAILLDKLSRGSEVEMDTNLNTYFKIIGINDQLQASKKSVAGAGISGALSGFSFGKSLEE